MGSKSGGVKRLKGRKLLDKYKNHKGDLEAIFQEKEVLLAYVFGSVAREEVGPLSDIDFAVYFEETLPKDRRKEVYLDILNELIDILGDDIDLASMNDADLLFNFNVVKSGENVFKNSEDDRIRIESEIVRRNLDMKYYRERHADAKVKRIAKGGLE